MYKQLVQYFQRQLKTHTEFFEFVLKWIGYLIAAAAVLWTALLYLAAKNDLHLVVWIEKESLVYPSEATWNQALPLKLDNTPAQSTRVLAIRVSNYGRTLIGEQKGIWRLSLEAPSSFAIEVLDLSKTPVALIVSQQPKSKPNSLELDIGALEPRASILLNVMLVNTNDKSHQLLTAKPSLPGLPYEVIRGSPSDKIMNTIAGPLVGSVFALFLFVGGPLRYAELRRNNYNGGSLAEMMLLFIILSVGVALGIGIFLAKGLAYVMVLFL